MQYGLKVGIMSQPKQILLLDDVLEMCLVLSEYLTKLGFQVHYITTIEEFKSQILNLKPDFIILDKNISGVDSFSLISQIRSSSNLASVPVLIITGFEDLETKMNAIQLGADDVLIKPFLLEELKLKIKALERRAYAYQHGSDEIVYKNLKLRPSDGVVFMDNEKIPFTDTEFRLLQTLILRKGLPIHRESLANKILTGRNINIRTIDVHINSIRNKLGAIGVKIKTLRGRGYMLVD